jgi:outer membrane protein assembly factor BamD
LFIMIRSYDKLGMPLLRDDTQRVFALNYPDSYFLNPNARGDAPWWKFWSKGGAKAAPKDAVQ